MFKENDDIYKTVPSFDPEKLKEALEIAEERIGFSKGKVKCISVTKRADGRPDPRGIFWTKKANYKEVQVEQEVNEEEYTVFEELLEDTYFREVYDELSKHYKLGRVRILKLGSRTSLSFHRDPEKRVHVPILTNPGALMIVDDFATHMVADGSTYLVNTKKYHTATNGGDEDRIHIVATVIRTANEQQDLDDLYAVYGGD